MLLGLGTLLQYIMPYYILIIIIIIIIGYLLHAGVGFSYFNKLIHYYSY